MHSSSTQRLLASLALIMVIALGPISGAAFAQADDAVENLDSVETDAVESDDSTDQVNPIDEKREQREDKIRDMKEKRADKVRDAKERITDQYKDRIRAGLEHDARPYDVPADREPDLYFNGHVEGWSLIGGYAYDSSTTLKGEAYHIRDNMWKIHVTEGEIQIGKRTAEIEMKGYVRGNHLMLRGIADLGEGNTVNIGLGGYYAPTQERGEFALSLTKLWYHTENNSGRIHLAQVGQVYVESNPDATDLAPMPEPAPIDIPEILS